MRILTDIIATALGIALLVHFALIWRYGSVLIQEPSRLVLVLETTMVVGLIAFSVFMFSRDSRG